MKRTILVASLLAATISLSQAADLTRPYYLEPTHYAADDWSGYYAGIFAGYGGARAVSVGTVNGTRDVVDLSGGLLGVTIGANAQYGSFVLGAEGDIAWSGLSGSTICSAGPATCAGSVDWLGTLRARAGVAVDPFLIYATGGLAVGGLNASVSPSFPGTTGSYSSTAVGWTLGAGVEAMLTQNISVKAEYAYVDLGTRQAPAGTVGLVNPFDISTTAHTFKLGANLHF